MKPATLALHAAAPDPKPGDSVAPPIAIASSFFTHPDFSGASPNELAPDSPHFYTRWSNPTIRLLEERLAEMEAGEAAVCFASGMAATSGLFFTALKPGDHLLLSNVCYAGVAELAYDTLTRWGIEVTSVNTADFAAVEKAFKPNTRLMHIETPGNPTLYISDIAAIAKIAHSKGVELSVDSTLGTPMATQPLTLGADYVIHSLTKYICGHGDAIGGVVIGKKDKLKQLRKEALIHIGGSMHPLAAWLILRGLESLAPRMMMHETNACKVAEFLEGHPRVDKVYWPGAASHPHHALARQQMKNFSGMVTFSAKDGPKLSRQMADRVKVFSYAISLGKAKSLIYYIPTDGILDGAFHLKGKDEEHYRNWAGDGMFRLSVGLEDADDLIADLKQALA